MTRTFTVYRNQKSGYTEAVKHGFSWPALFFGPFWMLVKKLWGTAILWIFLLMLLQVVQKALTDIAEHSRDADTVRTLAWILIASSVANLFLWLYPAFRGDKWRVSRLLRRGYVPEATLQAKTPDAAIAATVSGQSNQNGPTAWDQAMHFVRQ